MYNVMQSIKKFLIQHKKPILETISFIGFVVVLIFLFVLIINLNVYLKTDDRIYSINEIDQINGEYDCILVLGAGVRKDGSPTPMLQDRIITAFEAYRKTDSNIIFLSGDSERSDYTETVTMKNSLMDMGILTEEILSDGYGLSTYESIWRAKNIYGFDKIIIISQKYHLHRAIYIADKLGIEAIGIDAALQDYSKQPYYSLREYIARVKDVVYCDIRPDPNYKINWEDIYE